MAEFEKTVYYDMDNTIVDFDSSALRHIPVEERLVRQEFYVAHDYPEEMRPGIEAVYNDPEFFENLPLYDGVIETWDLQLRNGYYPQILSAPLTSNPRSVEGKILNLRRTLVPVFGKRVVDEAIFDSDKWRHEGLALNDDRKDIPRGPNGLRLAAWEHILFGWPHVPGETLGGTAFRLLDYSRPEAMLELVQRIEFEKKAT